MSAQLDHLVVAADTLDQGVAWCERTLGVRPGPGGRHDFMGTHNRLLNIGSAAFPSAYLEIIAIDPDAPAPPRPRWFGLDRPELRAALRASPRLLHAVVRCTALDTTQAALAEAGFDVGTAIAAERASAAGLLRWRIAVRSDGELLCGGALPTLIEWTGVHPTAHMAAGDVAVTALTLGGLPAPVQAALGLGGVRFEPAAAALSAVFDTPRGTLTLRSND